MARPTGVIFLIVAAGLWRWGRSLIVRADSRGLQWRKLLSKGSCSWNEITDYYLLDHERGRSDLAIETQGKTLWLSSQNWSHLAHLRTMIQHHTAPRLGFEWEKRGSRAQEQFPLTFHYTKAYSNVFGGMGWIGGVGIVVLCPLAIVYGESDTMHVAGLTARFIRAVGMVCGCGWVAYLYAQLVRMANDNRRRLDETLSVDSEGITLSTPTTSTFLRWSEITAYRREKPLLILSRYVLEAPHAEIRYTSAIRQSTVLRSVIERFVPPERRQLPPAPKPRR